MNLTSFTIVTLLAVTYAVLTLSETSMYRSWEAAEIEQQTIQLKVSYYHQANSYLQQLMQVIAEGSLHDQGLADMLKKYKIKVMVTNPPSASNPAPAANSQTQANSPAPAATPSTNAVPSSQVTPPSHP